MHEEEKLARDVYLTLGEAWNQPIFNNIAAAEQKHMDAILKKINSYGLTSSASGIPGEFSLIDLQDLHDDLVLQGEQSYVDALIVGATIEDMDIKDLLKAIKNLENTDNLALKTTYESLLEGSKNHLRAFIARLEQQGETYEPQFISPALFKAIVGF